MAHLYHYGTPRHSGRYPWGSGKNPYQHENFWQKTNELYKQGLSDKEVANRMGMSINKLRAKRTIAKNALDKQMLEEALRLKELGYSNVEIGKRIGKNESVVRYMLSENRQVRIDSTTKLANVLKEQLKEHPYLDVGKGVELQLNVSSTQLKTALEMLKEEGYTVHRFDLEQVSDPTHKTPMAVLTSDDVDYKEVRENQSKISSPEGIVYDADENIFKSKAPPINLDSNRIKIRYSEDGGTLKDGVIEIRPGVPDISLGENRYAQVRIAVDGSHYLKGMAMYADPKDFPKGIDIIFNTNKGAGTPMLGEDNDHSVLKKLKPDPGNPFGAITNPGYFTDENGNQIQTVMNIVNDDASWEKWSKNLSSQFLSKQPYKLAERQLDLAYKQKEQQYEDILALTNPTIKRKMLAEFADECDSAAVHLKGAAMPRQGTYTILPINSLTETEVYAPKFDQGEEVILIRYPHAGRFEIPRLIVNNNNKNAKSIIGNAEQAIGINAKVAQQLSGADFDGDRVVVIPTRGQNIMTEKPLKELKDFDPSAKYPAYPGMTRVGEGDGFRKGLEMGKVSNLITDMTIQNAKPGEIARAVKHSMVVIDAEKHNLDWKKSYEDNGIAELKARYQGGGGASTLISRAKADYRIEEEKPTYKNGGIDPKTGKKVFVKTGREYEVRVPVHDEKGNPVYTSRGTIKKVGTGKYKKAMTVTTRMAKTDDAFELSSGTKIEKVYALHANRLKALANKSRKELLSTPRLTYQPSAAKTYKKEVDSLVARLNVCLKNAPFERQAQLLANDIVSKKRRESPEDYKDKDSEKKLRSLAITYARDKVNAHRNKIDISDREWEAIQAGAISDTKLMEILRFADQDDLRKRSTPKSRGVTISSASLARARSWLEAGHTQSEVAAELGVSVSTLSKALKGE